MNRSTKALLMTLCLAGTAVVVPTLVEAGISVDINVAPPAPQVEVVPAARPGYVWAPGFWEWRGGQHVWIAGRWMGERRGYRWEPDVWVQRGPRWHHEPGHWVR
jgi:hypothetical protein